MSRKRKVHENSSAHQDGRMEPFPSSPARPPIIGIYMTNEDLSVWHYAGFAAQYSAAKFLERAEESQGKFHFEGDDIHFDTGWVLSTRGISDYSLKQLMDYTYTRAEDAWQLPDNYLAQYRLLGGARKAPDKEIPHGHTEPKRERTLRQPREGMVTLQDICSEFSVDASDARKGLRKARLNKPLSGWVWPSDHADLSGIKEIIKKCA